jgi:hypothetical protein
MKSKPNYFVSHTIKIDEFGAAHHTCLSQSLTACFFFIYRWISSISQSDKLKAELGLGWAFITVGSEPTT